MKNPSYKMVVKNIIHDTKKNGFIYNLSYQWLGKKTVYGANTRQDKDNI